MNGGIKLTGRILIHPLCFCVIVYLKSSDIQCSHQTIGINRNRDDVRFAQNIVGKIDIFELILQCSLQKVFLKFCPVKNADFVCGDDEREVIAIGMRVCQSVVHFRTSSQLQI